MLSKEEEERLENSAEVIGTEAFDGGNWEYKEFIWMHQKIKELNDELKRIKKEHRLAAFFVTDEELEVDVTHYSPEFYINAVRWLAEKLKETHEELKQLNFNHEQADQRLATALQVLQEANLLDKYLMLRGV